MPRFAVLSLLLFTCLACSGMGTESTADAEVEQLRAMLISAHERLEQQEALLETCKCPQNAPPVAAASKPRAKPAPAAAAPEPTKVVDPPPGDGPGEIEVKAGSTVKVLLDGKGISYNLVKSAYIARNVTPGPHLLEVQNALRKVIWSNTIEVVPGQRIRFQHRLGRKDVSRLGAVPVN